MESHAWPDNSFPKDFNGGSSIIYEKKKRQETTDYVQHLLDSSADLLKGNTSVMKVNDEIKRRFILSKKFLC